MASIWLSPLIFAAGTQSFIKAPRGTDIHLDRSRALKRPLIGSHALAIATFSLHEILLRPARNKCGYTLATAGYL